MEAPLRWPALMELDQLVARLVAAYPGITLETAGMLAYLSESRLLMEATQELTKCGALRDKRRDREIVRAAAAPKIELLDADTAPAALLLLIGMWLRGFYDGDLCRSIAEACRRNPSLVAFVEERYPGVRCATRTGSAA